MIDGLSRAPAMKSTQRGLRKSQLQRALDAYDAEASIFAGHLVHNGFPTLLGSANFHKITG